MLISFSFICHSTRSAMKSVVRLCVQLSCHLCPSALSADLPVYPHSQQRHGWPLSCRWRRSANQTNSVIPSKAREADFSPIPPANELSVALSLSGSVCRSLSIDLSVALSLNRSVCRSVSQLICLSLSLAIRLFCETGLRS